VRSKRPDLEPPDSPQTALNGIPAAVAPEKRTHTVVAAPSHTAQASRAYAKSVEAGSTCTDGLASSRPVVAALESRIRGRGLGSKRLLPTTQRGLYQRGNAVSFGRVAFGSGTAGRASPRAFSDGRATLDSAGNAVR
jgi:hypothetical protein